MIEGYFSNSYKECYKVESLICMIKTKANKIIDNFIVYFIETGCVNHYKYLGYSSNAIPNKSK